MPDYTAELQFALQVAQLGGAVAMEHYHGTPERTRKRDGSWVTEADLATALAGYDLDGIRDQATTTSA